MDLEIEEELLSCNFFDHRSSDVILGAVLYNQDAGAICEIRMWDEHFDLLKTLEIDKSKSGEVSICSTLVCSPYCIYSGDNHGIVHAWGKLSLHDEHLLVNPPNDRKSFYARMPECCSFKASLHVGKIVAMDVDTLYCYTMGADDAIIVSSTVDLMILCRIDLRDPVVVYNPKDGSSVTSDVKIWKHVARPCSRWAMTQSFPNRRGVTPQGPRGFVFATATNASNQGLLLKFDFNRTRPLAVQCTLAHSNPVCVCIPGPYDNGPIITIGEADTSIIHLWEIHSLRLIATMSIDANVNHRINSIAIRPQECFYSINTNGQIVAWAMGKGKSMF